MLELIIEGDRGRNRLKRKWASGQSHRSGPAFPKWRKPSQRGKNFFFYLFISTIRWHTGQHSAFRQQSREDIHIYLYLLYFFKHIHLKRLGLINIFRCPVTMAIGSADIILNLIFQLPQCASPVSRIIESLLPLSLSLSTPPHLVYYYLCQWLPHMTQKEYSVFFPPSFHFVYAPKINSCVIPLPTKPDPPFSNPTILFPPPPPLPTASPAPNTPAANLHGMTGNVGRSW